jgi:hypothetical protein
MRRSGQVVQQREYDRNTGRRRIDLVSVHENND